MAALGTGSISLTDIKTHLELYGESSINALQSAIDVFVEARANGLYYVSPPDRQSDFRGYDHETRPVEWIGLDFYCEEATPPTDNPPTSPTVSFVDKTHDEVEISWTGATDDNGVVAYGIYVDSELVDTVDATESTYLHTGLYPNTSYRFHVTAIDEFPQSSPLDEYVDVTTNGAPSDQVTAPTAGTVTGWGEGSLQITFSGATATAGIKGYNVYHRGVFHQFITASPSWINALREGTMADLDIETVDNNDNVSPTKLNIAYLAYPLFNPIDDEQPPGKGASRCLGAPDFVLHALQGSDAYEWYKGSTLIGTSYSIAISSLSRTTTYDCIVINNGIRTKHTRVITIENCNLQ